MSRTRTSQINIAEYDEAEINKTHWKMVFTAGMGFFTDAYDLFIIGVVTAILLPIWHLSTLELAVLNGASLASAAFGAVVFGWFADKFGRKKMYGIEVLILFIGAIMCALSPNFTVLLIARVVVGFGIGGDYPTSAVVASESANRQNRGFLVLLVFAMQAVGLIVGPMIASAMLAMNIPQDLAWRILLGLGAIPAASVFYLRRTISETPRFALSKQAPVEVSRVVSDLAGHKVKEKSTVKKTSLLSSKWLKCLIGTAGAWFLLDVAFYGNGVSSVLLMDAISPHASLLKHTVLSAMIFLCFAVPGYFFAAKFVDRIGRKRLQMLGFAVMAVCYLSIAWMPNLQDHVALFVILFGLSFFFVNFGPNSTTFLIPSEIFPTEIRARAHGLSAAIGKVGAFVGVFFLPLVLKSMGMPFTMEMVAIVSVLGIAVTTLVPEMKGVSLESIDMIDQLQPTDLKA